MRRVVPALLLNGFLERKDGSSVIVSQDPDAVMWHLERMKAHFPVDYLPWPESPRAH
jgi:hypothetical protein